MVEHVGDPRAAPGVPTLPDPDAWSARWALALAAVAIVSWLLPMPVLGDDLEPVGWAFPWSLSQGSRMELVTLYVPLLAALGALYVVYFERGSRRAVALTALGAAAWLVAFWGSGWVLPGPHPPAGLRRLGLQGGLLGGLAAAVGNHLRKRAPSSELARLLCVVGGALVVLAFLVPLVGRPFVVYYFDAEARGGGWPLLVASVLVLAYGLLGIRQAGSGPALTWLCAWMTRLSRILLVAPLAGLIGTNALTLVQSPFTPEASLLSWVVPLVKAWGAILGFAGGFAVGVAALLESRIGVQEPRPTERDPDPVSDVFA